jgi:signal transduction histidine kinase
MKHTVLCVDDESDNIDALERLFRKKYKVLKTVSPLEALTLLEKNPVTVIISDQRMPDMTGVELLARSIEIHPLAIRILLTGYTDIDSVISAINSGQIYRYVTKPWDPVDLLNAVDKAVERFEMGEELREKNVALSQALDELQTLDQAKNEFMLLVNHELKTPLTSLLSFTDLLAETRLDEEQKKYLSRIQTASKRLQTMISDVLEFVSAQTEQMKTDVRGHLSTSFFSATPEVVQKVVEARELHLQIDIENVEILTDEKILRNVLRRLLHNAVKFADAGSTVNVSGKQVADLFQIEMSNKGTKIDESQIRQILKPFKLNENALNHSTGTGLGLSICQALLKLLGSELHITCSDDTIRVSFSLKTRNNG